jgi:ferric-dicitrate binding protein FerR (iron transport regulator)
MKRFFESDPPEQTRREFYTWAAGEEDREEKEAAMSEIWDEIPASFDLSSLAELNRVKQRISSRRRLTVMAIAGCIILPVIILLTISGYGKYREATEETAWIQCVAPYGEQRQITMPDGSDISLNAGSVLLYPEKWKGRTRTVFLSGEGHFDVSHDNRRPFIVKTSHVEVEALGTVFGVQAYPDASTISAILEEGAVKVKDISGAAGSIILQPDEEATYGKDDGTLRKHHVDAARMNSWTKGYLIFNHEKLNNIFRALERKYDVRISYRDGKFSDMSFTVRFHADETLDEALKILKQIGANFDSEINGTDVFIK